MNITIYRREDGFTLQVATSDPNERITADSPIRDQVVEMPIGVPPPQGWPQGANMHARGFNTDAYMRDPHTATGRIRGAMHNMLDNLRTQVNTLDITEARQDREAIWALDNTTITNDAPTVPMNVWIDPNTPVGMSALGPRSFFGPGSYGVDVLLDGTHPSSSATANTGSYTSTYSAEDLRRIIGVQSSTPPYRPHTTFTSTRHQFVYNGDDGSCTVVPNDGVYPEHLFAVRTFNICQIRTVKNEIFTRESDTYPNYLRYLSDSSNIFGVYRAGANNVIDSRMGLTRITLNFPFEMGQTAYLIFIRRKWVGMGNEIGRVDISEEFMYAATTSSLESAKHIKYEVDARARKWNSLYTWNPNITRYNPHPLIYHSNRRLNPYKVNFRCKDRQGNDTDSHFYLDFTDNYLLDQCFIVPVQILGEEPGCIVPGIDNMIRTNHSEVNLGKGEFPHGFTTTSNGVSGLH